MVFLSNKFGNSNANRKDNMSSDMTAIHEPAYVPANEIKELEERLQSVRQHNEHLTRRLDSLYSVIHNLPWEDINRGAFNPQRGCSDVKNVIDALVDAGCDESVLMEGLKREFVASFRVMVSGFYRVEAIDEDDAEEIASELLENDYVSFGEAGDPEIESWHSVDWNIEQE